MNELTFLISKDTKLNLQIIKQILFIAIYICSKIEFNKYIWIKFIVIVLCGRIKGLCLKELQLAKK